MDGISEDALEVVLDQENRESREKITMDGLMGQSSTFIQSVRRMVNTESGILHIEGLKLADFFWSESERARSTGDKDQQCRVGTRVRRITNTISFEWYRNNFYKKSPSDTKMVVSSKYLKQTAQGKYSMKNFKNEPVWAQEIIEPIEKRYEVLRKRNAALKKIRLALSEYEKLVEKSNEM